MNFKNCLTGILLLSLKVCSQEIKPLTIGDAVPAIPIKNIFNYPALQSNLYDFKEKLVILDFMGTSCISCLKLLPHLDSVQKVYGDKIKIFLVTYEKKEKVKKFLQYHPQIKLSMIGEDTLLTKYFPHTYISHEVWINKGVVIAITFPEYVKAENIGAVLKGDKINWLVKDDAVTAQSTISKFSIIEFYLHTYNLFRLPANHIILEVKDKERFINTGKMYKDEWKQKNTFWSDSIYSPGGNQSSDNRREELNKYFGLYGRMEIRKVPCYVVKTMAISSVDPSLYTEEQLNISLSNLVYTLNENLPVPVLNEVSENKKIQISKASLKDIDLLQKQLKRYGIEIIQENREVKLLVISETKSLTKNKVL
jgi:thiol-disulfide isomerase/thioredoxin